MLYSYVVRWDHGFAPNPFYETCTVATCKPYIAKRQTGTIGYLAPAQPHATFKATLSF
jgi:hypothetical protein